MGWDGCEAKSKAMHGLRCKYQAYGYGIRVRSKRVDNGLIFSEFQPFILENAVFAIDAECVFWCRQAIVEQLYT